MEKKLIDMIPEREEEKLLPVQAKIPKALHDAVAKAKKKRGHTFTEIIEAAFRKYLEEVK